MNILRKKNAVAKSYEQEIHNNISPLVFNRKLLFINTYLAMITKLLSPRLCLSKVYRVR